METGFDVSPIQELQATTRIRNNPYTFVAIDWHIFIFTCIMNVAFPAAFWQFYANVSDYATRWPLRVEAIKNITYTFAAVFGPYSAIGLLSVFPIFRPGIALIVEHISSNANPVAILYALYLLTEMSLYEGGAGNRWILLMGCFMAFFTNFVLKKRGTFSMYYLNARYKTLDATLYPSLHYLFGWREHRYRYYYYFPEATPIGL